MMNRQKKQLLLARLDRIVHAACKNEKHYYQEVRNNVIRGLIRIQDGSRRGNDWVLEEPVYKNSRLIQAWHRMSMDLSI